MNSKSWADYPELGLKELNQKDVDLLISSGLWGLKCHDKHNETKDAFWLYPLDVDWKYLYTSKEIFVIKGTNTIVYT